MTPPPSGPGFDGESALDERAVVMASAEGVIVYWSPGAERAFGHPAVEALGRTLDLILPAEHVDAHWVGFRRAMASGAAEAEGRSSLFPVRCAGGTISERRGRLTMIRDPDGRVVAAGVVFA